MEINKWKTNVWIPYIDKFSKSKILYYRLLIYSFNIYKFAIYYKLVIYKTWVYNVASFIIKILTLTEKV